MAHEHGDSSLGGLVQKAIKTEHAISRGKTALRAIAKVLRKNGVSQKTILACVAAKSGGKKKKVVKRHDGTFEVQDIDTHDKENDIDTHDEEVGGVRDEASDDGLLDVD
jgi:hypothetical protein